MKKYIVVPCFALLGVTKWYFLPSLPDWLKVIVIIFGLFLVMGVIAKNLIPGGREAGPWKPKLRKHVTSDK